MSCNFRLAGGLALLSLACLARADHWVTDPITGCQVWSYGDPSDAEVATWSGACLEGKASGRGVLVVHDKQGLLATFDGEMADGKGNGFGVIKFRDDKNTGYDRYLGNFENSLPVGQGIFESSEGWRLEAEFDGSFDSGAGTLRLDAENNDGADAVIRGKFSNGKLVGTALIFYQKENGEIYFGDMEDGKRQGTGTIIHSNDDSYIGDFQNGLADGVGVYESADESITIGQFANGAPNGATTYISPEGDAYQGVFVDGVPDGLVLLTKEDGSQFVETWKDGEKQE